jgi:hypothetical protein
MSIMKERRKEELKKTEKIIEESHNAKNAYLESTCDEISRSELYQCT